MTRIGQDELCITVPQCAPCRSSRVEVCQGKSPGDPSGRVELSTSSLPSLSLAAWERAGILIHSHVTALLLFVTVAVAAVNVVAGVYCSCCYHCLVVCFLLENVSFGFVFQNVCLVAYAVGVSTINDTLWGKSSCWRLENPFVWKATSWPRAAGHRLRRHSWPILGPQGWSWRWCPSQELPISWYRGPKIKIILQFWNAWKRCFLKPFRSALHNVDIIIIAKLIIAHSQISSINHRLTELGIRSPIDFDCVATKNTCWG